MGYANKTMNIYNAAPLEDKKGINRAGLNELVLSSNGTILTDILATDLAVALLDSEKHRGIVAVLGGLDDDPINKNNVLDKMLKKLGANGSYSNITAYLAGESMNFPKRGMVSQNILKELSQKGITVHCDIGDAYPSYARFLELDPTTGSVSIYRIFDAY
jgi:hypothetical protein